MDLGLEGRVALVTGSSRGIGRATALAFGREGARVVITYRNDRDRAEAAAAEVRDAGGEALVVQYDLASDDAIRAAVDAALERWDRIDILVNNAVAWGSRRPQDAPPFEELPPDEWRPLLRANLEGAMRTIQLVAPSMRARRWGRIVNVSSGIAVDGVPRSGVVRPRQGGAARPHAHAGQGVRPRRDPRERGDARVHAHGGERGALPCGGPRAPGRALPDPAHPPARGGRADDRVPLLRGQHGRHGRDHSRERGDNLTQGGGPWYDRCRRSGGAKPGGTQ